MQIRLPALFLTAGLCLSSAALACDGTDLAPGWSDGFRAEVADMAAGQPFPEGRFWEVRRDGAVSVLFGTIHLNDDDVATPPPALIERVMQADELFLEITREEEQRMMRSILLNPSKLLSPAGRKLSDTLTKDEWNAIVPVVKDYGITAEMADQIVPWYLTITLANPACLIAASATGKSILDRRIEKIAKESGVTVTGLESYEDVFGLFSGLEYEQQVDMLRAGLPTFALSEDYLETTKQMYIRGEIQQIWSFGMVVMREQALAENVEKVAEQFFDTLLITRNKRWMQTLVPKLAQGNRVIAVGALHLGGENGLLRMLEGEGFTIRRLD